jgi:hypothetical protein
LPYVTAIRALRMQKDQLQVGIPSTRAIAGPKLQSDLLVAIRNPQRRTCDRIWLRGEPVELDPAVAIPVMTQHYAMLQRNLLYTGVTHGKACSVGWSEEGRCHRSAQRLRPTALVEAGGMVERGRLEMSGVTHATIAVAVLFGEQENTEQVNCVVSSILQACPVYPPIADVSPRRHEPPLRARNRQSWTAVMRPCCRTYRQRAWQVSLMVALGWDRFEEC